MDPFDDLLRGVRADGAVFGRSVLSPPWALRFTDGPSMTLCVPLRGEGWITHPGENGRAHAVRLGEVAIVRGPEPFVFADEPGAAARPHPPLDVRCGAARAGSHTGDAGGPDGRRGRDGRGEPGGPGELDGRTVLMAGAYHVRGEAPRRLLRVLPPVLVVADHHDCAPLRDYFETQLAGERPGRQIVLDRLLDWLLVCTLREWFDRPESVPPAWYRALGDDVAGPVLRAMHEAPDRPWTLTSLAAEAGVSRTTLAKRFTELVGEPPLAYLTEWRMALAADLLAEPATTVTSVARRVGYADAFGFSTAFKRVRGTSPSAYRKEVATAGPYREEPPGPGTYREESRRPEATAAPGDRGASVSRALRSPHRAGI
ncbi:cupin [Planomonospora venezuelensis]|uniref:AraC-like DNA-binding protein n=1 Tax=Planomonospora venezuelensis TaxID=1999 RepID=A0A841D928_PLAVE|nr:AraC family transcriptional regulator [Planomonospora venezuelensis]MBB5965363.1 AraC-like DNA-binding protein [Planomonospora venezuelensis]GIN05130.1 cupin [Planomonospora venezuelensis]